MELGSAADPPHIATVNYRIILRQSEEGWAVSCPALPGCHSQGATREEAEENIRVAIREWLEVEAAENGTVAVVEEEITV
jgi:predicted RNase H-like HicB family nuclease